MRPMAACAVADWVKDGTDDCGVVMEASVKCGHGRPSTCLNRGHGRLAMVAQKNYGFPIKFFRKCHRRPLNLIMHLLALGRIADKIIKMS